MTSRLEWLAATRPYLVTSSLDFGVGYGSHRNTGLYFYTAAVSTENFRFGCLYPFAPESVSISQEVRDQLGSLRLKDFNRGPPPALSITIKRSHYPVLPTLPSYSIKCTTTADTTHLEFGIFRSNAVSLSFTTGFIGFQRAVTAEAWINIITPT
jgi:outer membrane protein assembly factor BamA